MRRNETAMLRGAMRVSCLFLFLLALTGLAQAEPEESAGLPELLSPVLAAYPGN